MSQEHNTADATTTSGVQDPITTEQSTRRKRHHVKRERPSVGVRYSLALLKRCVSYFRPYKLLVFLGLIGMTVSAVAQGSMAWLLKPTTDNLFIGQDAKYLMLVPLGFILVTILKAGGRLLQQYMMQWAGLKVLETLRADLYNKIISLPLRFFESAQVGMLMSRIINDVNEIRTSLPAVIMIIRQIFTIIFLLIMAYRQNVELAIISTIVMPIAFFPFMYFGKKLRKLGRKGQEIIADATVLLQEILSGIRVIKAFATEKPEGIRFDKANKSLMKNALRKVLMNEGSSASMELVGAICICIVLFLGGSKVISGVMTPGEFTAFIASLAMLYEPVKKLSTANNDIQRALACAERVFEILDAEDIIEEQGGDLEFKPPLQHVEFSHVCFSYDSSQMALNDINISISPGERLAIVGPSGGGKSTLVNLLSRFYDPDSGVISINGHNIREYTLPSLRRNVAMVSQDNFLFNLSVRDNIAYGQELDDATVLKAAQAAYAHEFIMAMPNGYDTLTGERGVKLSGGQKQRLTIARAIAKNAPLLILDEATSALDSESEHIVQKALDNLMQGRTSIVIAHRLSTILSSDRILVMNQGSIVAQGTHHELLASCALYAKLYEMQFGENNS